MSNIFDIDYLARPRLPTELTGLKKEIQERQALDRYRAALLAIALGKSENPKETALNALENRNK